ncbi:MAG: hypothetical protein J6U99_00445 [Rikenellaceae bacterium]|nr:hypothetical protein [Rikenellaceae bacterium]
MRKFSFIFSITLFMVGAFSCVSRQTAKQLTSQKDSLALVAAAKDSILNDVFASLTAISENLDMIKSRENIVTAQSGELNRETKTKIAEDIQEIDQLLLENRQTIERLKNSAEQLRKANVRIAKLDKLVATLNAQIDQKDREITSLKENLEKRNVEVKQLTSKVATLNSTVAELDIKRAALEIQVDNQARELNTAYYIVGTAKELIAQGVITKSGFLKKTFKVNGNTDINNMTRVDIRTTSGFKINHKRIAIASTHPSDSYTLVKNANGEIEKLEIKDRVRFWESSRLFVVVCK